MKWCVVNFSVPPPFFLAILTALGVLSVDILARADGHVHAACLILVGQCLRSQLAHDVSQPTHSTILRLLLVCTHTCGSCWYREAKPHGKTHGKPGRAASAPGRAAAECFSAWSPAPFGLPSSSVQFLAIMHRCSILTKLHR